MSQELNPRDSLASILAIERIGDSEFIARLEDFWGSALGADVIARSALAADETASGRQLHSLHATYLGSLPSRAPLRLLVERLSDTRSSSRRRVQVLHGEQLVCKVSEVGHAGRIFSRRELYSAAGVLVASSSQEGFYSSDDSGPR